MRSAEHPGQDSSTRERRTSVVEVDNGIYAHIHRQKMWCKELASKGGGHVGKVDYDPKAITVDSSFHCVWDGWPNKAKERKKGGEASYSNCFCNPLTLL